MERLRDHLPSLLALVGGIALGLLVEPQSRNDSHYWRMWLAVAAVGFVGLRWAVWRFTRDALPWRQTVRSLMVLAATLGVFNYYQFDRRVFTGIGDPTDITYYYLNSKYLDELGYYGLYAAMLQADLEHEQRHVRHVRQVRDLRDYEVRPAAEQLAWGRQLRDERFTPERWDQFKHDADTFLRRFDRRAITSNFFVDHGYNPPPTWALVGGTLATLVPVEQVAWITQFDTLLVVGMFAGIAWAFGFEAMLWALLFAVCTFSGRWPILGQSLTRFDWVVALVLSVCFLRKQRPAAAGAAMAYAALNRIFPAVFFLAWGAAVVRDLVRSGRPSPEQQRFGLGAAAAAAAMIGTAIVLYGPGTFGQSAHNLAMHNESYSSHRVGLGDLLVFRGETTREQINATGGIAEKEKTVQRLQPVLRLIGLGAVLFVGVYVFRVRRPLSDLVVLAILPLYCVTNPQINYYNLRILLVLWHAATLVSPAHRAGLAWVFLIEAATQYTKVVELDRYTTTSTTSVGLAIYFLGLMGWMIADMRRARFRAPLAEAGADGRSRVSAAHSG